MKSNIVIAILGIVIITSLMLNKKSLFRNKVIEDFNVLNDISYKTDTLQFEFIDSTIYNKLFYEDGVQKILIFRYFENECFQCIVDDIDLIANWHFADVEKNHVVLIPNMPRNRNDSILISSTIKNLNYIGVEDSIIDINNIKKKYFAILDRECNVNYLFYPDKRHPIKTEKFFEIIESFF